MGQIYRRGDGLTGDVLVKEGNTEVEGGNILLTQSIHDGKTHHDADISLFKESGRYDSFILWEGQLSDAKVMPDGASRQTFIHREAVR